MLDFFKKDDKDKERVIAEAIVNVRESRETLEQFAPQFMDWSVEAAQMGEDAYSDDLLNTMAELEDFVSDLKALEMQIRTEAVIAKSLDNLTGLSKALKGCNSLFKSGPRVAKAGADIQLFKKNMGEGVAALKGLRRKITGGITSNEELLTGRKPAENLKVSALREKRDILLMKPATVIEPKTATGDIDIDAIIEDEKSKK
jgi:hypothetical protein